MLPSRCAGWAVQDVLYHQLLDARRALVTFATPSATAPQALGGDGAARHARHVRIAAAACETSWLAGEWRETSSAARHG
jgi:hypothetical protein